MTIRFFQPEDIYQIRELTNAHLDGEIAEMQVNEEWQNRGIGTWLVQHAIEWVRLAGCDRVVFNVAAEDEAAGAGRYYERFGWTCLTRLRKGWRLLP